MQKDELEVVRKRDANDRRHLHRDPYRTAAELFWPPRWAYPEDPEGAPGGGGPAAGSPAEAGAGAGMPPLGGPIADPARAGWPPGGPIANPAKAGVFAGVDVTAPPRAMTDGAAGGGRTWTQPPERPAMMRC